MMIVIIYTSTTVIDHSKKNDFRFFEFKNQAKLFLKKLK